MLISKMHVVAKKKNILSRPIGCVRSGGQSGADRAALDTARKFGMPITGWVPKDGWAEDFTTAPGVLTLYPELMDTGAEDVNVRTNWNVRDADALLAFIVDGTGRYMDSGTCSPGTDYTIRSAIEYGKKYFVCDIYDVIGDFGEDDMRKRDMEAHIVNICRWLNDNNFENIELDIGGPRESEAPGTYQAVCEILREVLK